MKRSSLVVGVMLSMLVHVALIVVSRRSPPLPPREDPTPVPTVVVTPPMPEPEPEPEPVPEPEPELVRLPVPEPVAAEPPPKPAPTLPKLDPAPLELTETAETLGSIPDVPALAPIAAPDPTDEDDPLPPLRITWGGPDELRVVAKQLGMRIVAVDGLGKVLGEVVGDGGARIESFEGSFADYSNRVRTLPRRFFGKRLSAAAGRPVSSFWILVPVNVDQQMTETIQGAIEAERASGGNVRWVEAEFKAGPKLVVTRLHR